MDMEYFWSFLMYFLFFWIMWYSHFLYEKFSVQNVPLSLSLMFMLVYFMIFAYEAEGSGIASWFIWCMIAVWLIVNKDWYEWA